MIVYYLLYFLILNQISLYENDKELIDIKKIESRKNLYQFIVLLKYILLLLIFILLLNKYYLNIENSFYYEYLNTILGISSLVIFFMIREDIKNLPNSQLNKNNLNILLIISNIEVISFIINTVIL